MKITTATTSKILSSIESIQGVIDKYEKEYPSKTQGRREGLSSRVANVLKGKMKNALTSVANEKNEQTRARDINNIVEEHCKIIASFITHYEKTNTLAKELKAYFVEGETGWSLIIAHERDKRAAERADKWKLWGQQLARWTIGVFFGVFLYSTLVYWGETSKNGATDVDFIITIPGKDWFNKG